MRMSGQALAASASLSSVAKLAPPSSALANSKAIWPLISSPVSLSSQALARRSRSLAACDAAGIAGCATDWSALARAGSAPTVSGLPGGAASAPLVGADADGVVGSEAGGDGGGSFALI